jgi:hypothetical protein
MDLEGKSRAEDEQKDEATDSRTLDEIEDQKKVSDGSSNSPLPSPDEGAGRDGGDDAGQPM